jgi:hypothetical protein
MIFERLQEMKVDIENVNRLLKDGFVEKIYLNRAFVNMVKEKLAPLFHVSNDTPFLGLPWEEYEDNSPVPDWKVKVKSI